jgi:RimJ/RimL family protein N-acetyltransferase
VLSILQSTTEKELRAIEQIARFIWHEHYTPIIGKEQVEYMLEKFQSTDVMLNQVAEGYRYYSVVEHLEPFHLSKPKNILLIGYFAIKPEEDSLFISKFYLHPNARGNGYGRTMLTFIKEQAESGNLSKLRLTVNKYNTNSISAYEKMGFVKKEAAVFDIGNGYVMDDFVMELFLM